MKDKDKIKIIKKNGILEKMLINGIEAKCIKKIKIKENFDFSDNKTEVLVVFSNPLLNSVDN